MKDFWEMFEHAWPGMLLIAGIIGSTLAWFATKQQRKETAFAQSKTIEVYEQTIKAQKELALTLAEAAKEKEAIHAEEIKRHENTITQYRTQLHDVRNQLQDASTNEGNYKAQVAELKARTDFKPVLDFQQTWYEENKSMNKEIVETLKITAPILQEVSIILKEIQSSRT